MKLFCNPSPAARLPRPLQPGRRSAALLLAAAACIPTAALRAQPGSVPEVASQRQQTAGDFDDLYEANDQATGRDIILMVDHQPWYVEASLVGEYTSNAFLASDDREDYLALLTVRGGFETVVAEKYSVRAELSALGARYARFDELDYDRLGASFTAAMPVGDWAVGLAYEPSLIFDDGFGDRNLTQHQLSVFARRTGQLRDDLSWFFASRLSRTFSDPDDFDNNRLSANGGLIWQWRPGWVLQGGLQLSAQQYDDYFENLTGETRRDFSVTPYVSLGYRIDERFDAALSLRYTDNRSSLDPLDYTAKAISPSLTFNWRF